MLSRGIAQKVTIYLNQDTHTHLDTLWSAILNFLRHQHVSGATLIRAERRLRFSRAVQPSQY